MMKNNNGYEEKQTQKQRLLKVLQEGKKVCQINLNHYLELRKCQDEGQWCYYDKKDVIDGIADLGIANLPARIFGLKKDGYEIKTEKIHLKGRYGKTHYCVYSLANSEVEK